VAVLFFFSSRRRHTRSDRDWSSDVCSSDLFKPGNRAARYFAGFGAGQQKIEVECVLKNKTTGEVVAKEVITDRKVAGWAGGSERSEERRVGKSVDWGGGGKSKKKRDNKSGG